ncbi:ABC transporter ATP-binding protein [Paenochrobactrum pullorum]|uniref:ABC transporter ATP-binding protein n=1 Tax=Paenochrobactrum pullorum TaxID=1324351 RepID=UPI0035BC734A
MQLVLDHISVSFAGLSEPALQIDHLEVPDGAVVGLTGASGSGKSTFINIISGLARPQKGLVLWGGQPINQLSETAADRWRGEHIGLIMQDFYLFDGLSALENILLPLRLAGGVDKEALSRAHELLERVGLKRPDQAVQLMSRGEMQRVAIARALQRKPAIIIADEPTASLDKENGASVGNLILELATQEKCTTIIASHDDRLISRLARTINLAAGRITSDV